MTSSIILHARAAMSESIEDAVLQWSRMLEAADDRYLRSYHPTMSVGQQQDLLDAIYDAVDGVHDELIDALGELIEAKGWPSMLSLVQGSDIPDAHQHDLLLSATLSHYFDAIEAHGELAVVVGN